MTNNEQNVSEKSRKGGVMSIVFLFVLMITVASMFPVYMQNSINRLYGNYYGLREKANLLNREILLRDYEINKLTSMNHLAKFAEQTGLGLNSVPMKVMIMGETRE
jgi:cell division protein FtsL